MATSEGIPSSIDIEFLELNDNPYNTQGIVAGTLRQPAQTEYLQFWQEV